MAHRSEPWKEGRAGTTPPVLVLLLSVLTDFLKGQSRTMLEMEWFCYFNKDGHSGTESCGILSLSS